METIHTGRYTRMELFARSSDGKRGMIRLTGPDGREATEAAGDGYFRWIRIPLFRDSSYQVSADGCLISVCYLCGQERILDEGVCFLEDWKPVERKAYGRHYDTPYREQYHFNPYKNWINDPNGLCWYKGRYHMYYQANPHGQSWDDMYWGHAVSKDLVHWVHLPYALEPQEELHGDPDHKGGAFSGSAVAEEEEILFYLTRHYGPQQDGEGTLEWQVMTRSTDSLTLEEEKEIIREKPEGAGHDFRDPKVVEIGGRWYMALASNLNGKSAILLYESENRESWSYAGPLLTEPDPGSTTFECPDFFHLDGTYAAFAALMRHVDEFGRRQMTRCYLGSFEGGRLKVEHTQWFDFGSSCYAVQSFEHDGRRIAIGWVCDIYGEHVRVENGAYGSMSIPRELCVKGGRLYMNPVKEIYELLDQKLYDGRGPASLECIQGNSYYARVRFRKPADFELLLEQDRDRSVSLVCEGGVTELRTVGAGSGSARFVADVKEVREAEIFVDRRTVEIYLNGGEAAGTRIFYNSCRDGVFRCRMDREGALEQMELYSMKSIW